MSIGHSEPAQGVDQWSMSYRENIPVPPTTEYGARDAITMQVRNAPNGQRATRQVATGGVHHFDVQSFPNALHVNLYSDTSAGWLLMRREIAQALYDALGNALGKPAFRKTVADSLEAIENAYPDDPDLADTLNDIRRVLDIHVSARVDTSVPASHSETNYSELHGPF